jgi:hypothetical protein
VMISTNLIGISILFIVPNLGIIGASLCEIAVHFLQIGFLYYYVVRQSKSLMIEGA